MKSIVTPSLLSAQGLVLNEKKLNVQKFEKTDVKQRHLNIDKDI